VIIKIESENDATFDFIVPIISEYQPGHPSPYHITQKFTSQHGDGSDPDI